MIASPKSDAKASAGHRCPKRGTVVAQGHRGRRGAPFVSERGRAAKRGK